MDAVQRVRLALRPGSWSSGDVPVARRLARAVFEAAEPFGLLVFAASEPRIELLLAGSGELARACARHLRLCLAPRLGLAFAGTVVSAVLPGDALRWQTLAVLRRPPGAADPLAEASNLPELLGLRVAGRGTRLRLAQRLPQLQRASLEALLPRGSWDASQPEPALLRDAAAAAVGLSGLEVAGADGERARAAAWLAARALGLRVELPPTRSGAAGRLLAERTGGELVDAVIGQLRLRSALAQRLVLGVGSGVGVATAGGRPSPPGKREPLPIAVTPSDPLSINA